MGKLYIIGTEHTDLISGPEKLLRLYDVIRPDILLEEMNDPDMMRYQAICAKLECELKRLSRDHQKTNRFMALIRDATGFEGAVNSAYSKRHRVPVYRIDLPGGQAKMIDAMESTIEAILQHARSRGEVNLDRWMRIFASNISSPEEVKANWQKYAAYEGGLKGEAVLLAGRWIGRIGKPDKHMAAEIRRLYDPTKVIAFPVGMLHTLRSPSRSTVYSKLQDLAPERVPLI